MKQRIRMTSDKKIVANEVSLALLPLAKSLVETRVIDEILAEIRRLNLGIFRLVVMGEIKKGKSSFINALISEPELLPTSSDIATSTVFKLMYGPKRRYKIFFLPDPESRAVAPVKEVLSQELIQYGTEDGNPGNEKRVDFIGIEIPHPLLQTGLVIVDTPGVGGLFKAHKDITWRFAPNADGVVFVLDSVESVISADEVTFLRDLIKKFTKRLIFVQTKIDNASEELWNGWEVRNKAILNTDVGIAQSKLFYFPVSAKLKNTADKLNNLKILERSGFPPLINFLNGRLIPAKEDEIANRVIRKLLSIAVKVKAEIHAEKNVYENKNTAQLLKLESERRASVEQFSRWEQDCLTPKLAEASAVFSRKRRDYWDKIEELLNPSGRLLHEFMERQSNKSAVEIQEQVRMIQQDFLELLGISLDKIFNEFVMQYSGVCKDVAESLRLASDSHELSTKSESHVDLDYRKVSSLPMSASSNFETYRNIMFGGFAGATIANVAISVASVVFPPLAGLNFVALIAGVYGAREAKRLGEERRKDESIGRLRVLLTEMISQVRKSLQRHFEDKAEECAASLQAIFKSAKEQIKSDLDRRLAEVIAAGKRTKEEAKLMVDELDAKSREVDLLMNRLKACTTPQ